MREHTHIIEEIVYYLKSFLLTRPRKRAIERFIKKVLMKQIYEFKTHNVFLVHNVDIGALLIPSARFYPYAGRYEVECIKILKCLFNGQKQGLFIDVGAYVGFYTILAAKHSWRVLAFEPNPLSLVLLRYNIALHNVGDKVIVVSKVVGDRVGYVRFTIASDLSESSLTGYQRRELRLIDVTTEVVTLDSIMEALNVEDDVNIIMKIDVECFGLNVVKGTIKTISRFKPYIIFEVHRTF